MRTLLLCFATAAAVIATPTAAQVREDPSATESSASHDGWGGSGGHHHRRIRHSDTVFVTDFDSADWALYNNRSWDPDSYTDWWHDRPDRAYPRWVQEQRGTACSPDRMWWSGSGWHC